MHSINDAFIAADDGTRIAYRVEGNGPAIVLTNGLTTTTTFWKYVRPIWLQRHTVVTWDLPGHGNSSPAQTDQSTTVEAQASFIARIMRTTGINRASQIGWSTGTQVVLETCRLYPELCQSVVLMLGGAGHALSHTRLVVGGASIDWLARMLPRSVFVATSRILSSGFRKPGALQLGRLSGVIGPQVTPADMRELTDHIASVDFSTLQRMLRSVQAHSAQSMLATLRLPLLIVSGDKDNFAPTDPVGLALKRAVPNSDLLRLPQGTHTALLEEPRLIAETVARFLVRASN
jgi:pimeloyl-ACP methyl ester carboxylesterase